MGRNVVIFSDGTGQAGGFRFDEKRSNIYKLYRATRCGPDSSIDPRRQATFYDPGLGSQADGGHLAGRFARWVYNRIAQATGFGITRNVIDCYAALIRLWRPGDRIFLFGFSRGAYTVRCLAGVIAKCGIPRHLPGLPEESFKRDEASTQELAAAAVKHVYQFTYPRKTSEATPRQRFLLEVRDELAARFRRDHGSADPLDPAKANVYPHFIGVFDTVAALGNPVTSAMLGGAFLVLAALGAAVCAWFGRPGFWPSFGMIIMVAAAVAGTVFVYTHFKWAHEFAGEDWDKARRSMHFNDVWMTFYDYDLNPNVAYARQALSIDESRKSFQRVPWNSVKHSARDERGFQWFEQVWFAGNHSDIGGSYPEEDARLSDIALDWMVKWAKAVPDGLDVDSRVLELSPYPEGRQHDEVRVGWGSITQWTGLTWPQQHRKLPGADAIVHRSVYRRFDLPSVQVDDVIARYRPQTLAEHKDFGPCYAAGAPFPATSESTGTQIAEEPPGTAKP
jgi:uncharacterized protein (DUF2235 family)